MTNRYLSLACLGLTALAWALAPQPADAWGENLRLPWPCNTSCNWNPYWSRNSNCNWHCNAGSGFHWNFNCSNRPVIQLAPWYTYFPLDPHLTAPSAGTAHYPDWPQPFPPQPTPQSGSPASAPGYAPPGYAPPGYTPIAPRPSPIAAGNPQVGYPQAFQPVGYVNFQPPSYWYGR
ncbi:MAG: hypothetical protein HY040_04720 [Planctomycetes bacterium]|nr:hypothetical protein [Planctomycetota bacterium]